MKLSPFFMIGLGLFCILFVRGGQLIYHPEWTEIQSLINMWPSYLLGLFWILLGAWGLRAHQ